MREVEFNRSRGLDLKILCPTCETETRHMVIQSTDIVGRKDFDEILSIDWETKHQIIECQGCLTISYREESQNSEEFDPQTGNPLLFVRLYPLRSKDTLFPRDFLNSPPNLKRIYREIIDCYNNQSFTLCAAGLRSLIEGICDEAGTNEGPADVSAMKKDFKKNRKKTLQGKIGGLYEKNILTDKEAAALQQNRYMGNDPLHALRLPTPGELDVAIRIVEHAMDTLFESSSTFRKLYNKLSWRSRD